VTDQQCDAVIGILMAAYRQDLSEAEFAIRKQFLADLPFEPTKEAVSQLVRTSKFFPTIAEIRDQTKACVEAQKRKAVGIAAASGALALPPAKPQVPPWVREQFNALKRRMSIPARSGSQ